MRRLLAERVYIYAKLYNPGGSIILRASDIVDHDRPEGYSTAIGNVFHLDLIELQQQFDKLIEDGAYSKQEIDALLTWADGLTSKEAADFLHATGAVNVRKLRSRSMQKLQERLDDGARKDTGGIGNRDFARRRQETQDDPVQRGDD